jgi:hypothetical protein
MYTENDRSPPHKKGGNLKLNDTDWQKRESKNFTTNDRIKQDVFFNELEFALVEKKTGGSGGRY